MRLFVAADISDDTRRALQRVREQLRPRLEAEDRPPRLVWVGDEAAHVTLRFIGSVPDAAAIEIEGMMREPFAIEPFDVTWDALGTFPGGRSPRVIWIGASAGLDPMRRLADVVNARIDRLVPSVETRPFAPHLTVARVKDPGHGVNWAGALAAVTLEPTLTRVAHVTLYESRVTDKGSTYTVRTRTRFG
jgi:2'-5' RNA ligase